jgi:hypothetical protein
VRTVYGIEGAAKQANSLGHALITNRAACCRFA